MDDLKKYCLDILLEIDRICKKYSIDYYLYAGTLLGAVRHKGFIPWDDDIDVVMFRKDYNRFLDICKKESKGSRYELQTIETDPYTNNPWAKLHDKNTAFISGFRREEAMEGVNIDIFPIDNAPDNSIIRKVRGILVDKCNYIYQFRFAREFDECTLKMRIFRKIIACIPPWDEMKQEEYVEKILFNTQRLSGLVGNILLLSKLENQNIPMKKTEYRLDEQIRQAFLSLETKWTEKEIGFQVELEEVKYTGNEGLFMHIWMNLLDNAIKFSPAKGTIMMFLKQEKDSVMFILEDEGPGIEDDVKTRIFDKFYQADGSHKAEGNGLGLALVKRIVDSAGGTIKAENREYGGCRFVVELPIQKDEAI